MYRTLVCRIFSLDVESIIVRLKDSYEQYNDICIMKVTVVVMVFSVGRLKTSCILGIISAAAKITYIDKLQFLDSTLQKGMHV